MELVFHSAIHMVGVLPTDSVGWGCVIRFTNLKYNPNSEIGITILWMRYKSSSAYYKKK